MSTKSGDWKIHKQEMSAKEIKLGYSLNLWEENGGVENWGVLLWIKVGRRNSRKRIDFTQTWVTLRVIVYSMRNTSEHFESNIGESKMLLQTYESENRKYKEAMCINDWPTRKEKKLWDYNFCEVNSREDRDKAYSESSDKNNVKGSRQSEISKDGNMRNDSLESCWE